MFDIHCNECQKRQLIFPSQISRLVNDDEGIVVFYTCWCGAAGAWRTGSAAPVSSTVSPTFAQAPSSPASEPEVHALAS